MEENLLRMLLSHILVFLFDSIAGSLITGPEQFLKQIHAI